MQTVPERWRKPLDDHLSEQQSDARSNLSASEFRHNVRLQFPDGSSVFMRHAFHIVDTSLNEIAVFTEHCGYHYFPLHGTEAELMYSVRGDIGTD